MKKFLVLILVVILSISLVACGKNEEINKVKNDGESKVVINQEKSKTAKFAKEYLSGNHSIKMEMLVDEVSGLIINTMAVKDGKLYTNVVGVTHKELNSTFIEKDGKQYVVYDEQKMYMVNDKIESQENDFLDYEESDFDKEFTTGKHTIDGVEYEYEEFVEKDEEEEVISRFYYDGDILKYISTVLVDGTENIIKVLEYSNEVPDFLFDIPSNYQQIAY